jgi:hypothetical protein
MARKSSAQKAVKGHFDRPVFDAIRKPIASPGHPLSRSKPDEVARPAGRKAKHKQRPDVPGDEEV